MKKLLEAIEAYRKREGYILPLSIYLNEDGSGGLLCLQQHSRIVGLEDSFIFEFSTLEQLYEELEIEE